MKHICDTEDDNGVVCNNPMTQKQFDQDGMCSRCADLLWENFYKPLGMGKPTKPIIFESNSKRFKIPHPHEDINQPI